MPPHQNNPYSILGAVHEPQTFDAIVATSLDMGIRISGGQKRLPEASPKARMGGSSSAHDTLIALFNRYSGVNGRISEPIRITWVNEFSGG